MSMSSYEAVGLMEMWAGIKNYVPAKDQDTAAMQFITMSEELNFVDYSHPPDDIFGICDLLDKNIRIFRDENGYMDEDDDEPEWDE